MTASILPKRRICGLFFLVLFAVGACRSQTPPGPLIVSHTVARASCLFFIWPAGLRVMFWVDIIDNINQDGTSATDDAQFHQSGYALAADGRRVDWQLATADGQHATLHIDAQPQDLAAGTLFLITTVGGSTQIQQLTADLADLPSTAESCQQVAAQNPAVGNFVQAANKLNLAITPA